MREHQSQSGFSVIEALAALVIVAVALVPLLALQANVAQSFYRQDEERDLISLQRDALALLRDINVAARPSGALSVGDARTIRWTSRPLSEFVRTTQQGRGDGNFEVALYRLAVTTTLPSRPSGATFYLDQVGWRRLESSTSKPAGPPGAPMAGQGAN